jgi:hypothetical protein
VGHGAGSKETRTRLRIVTEEKAHSRQNAFPGNVNTVQVAPVIRSIEQADVQPAGEVLASAFRSYPFFEYCLGDADNYERMAPRMFASFVRWTMLYGRAWTTNDLNAVALRRPPGTRSIRFWNALRSGLVLAFCGWTLPRGDDLAAQRGSSKRLTSRSWAINRTGIVG